MPGPLNLGGLGGGGVSGGVGPLGNIDVGSLVQAATMPPGLQFLQGLATLPDAFNKAQFDAGQAQEQRLKAKDFQMQMAKNQWDQTVSMIQKNPSLAKSPAFIKQMTASGATLGYQVPLAPDGGIDPSVYGTNFNEFMKDKAFSDTFNAASPKQRIALLQERGIPLSSVPQSAIDMDSIYSPKETQLLGQLNLNEVNSEDRRKNQDARTKAMDDHDYGMLNHYARLDATNQQNANTRLIDVKQKVHIAQIRADALVTASKNRATTSGKYYQYLVHAAEQGSQQAHRTLQDAIDARDKYAATGVDADDPQLVNYNAEIKTAQDAVTTADQRRTDAVESTPDANELHSKSVSTSTGKQATVTNHAPQGNYIVGHSYTDANGRRAIYLGNGQWQPQ